jgi:hypothetical protein
MSQKESNCSILAPANDINDLEKRTDQSKYLLQRRISDQGCSKSKAADTSFILESLSLFHLDEGEDGDYGSHSSTHRMAAENQVSVAEFTFIQDFHDRKYFCPPEKSCMKFSFV